MREKIHAIIEALQSLEVRASYNNLDKLLGSIQMLTDIEKELAGAKNNGNVEIIPDEK